MDIDKLKLLISNSENEIVEFKENNEDPERIGKYVSALANSSALLNKQFSYIVWGIEDATGKIVGTNFYPKEKKKGGEPFISWLERMLEPRINITFEENTIEGKHVVVLVIQMSAGRPISFSGQKYIRSGSSLKNLFDYPEKERELWKSFESRSFEKEFAKTNLDFEEVTKLIDVKQYIKMLGYPEETNTDQLTEYLIEDGIIEASGSKYNITNMGAFTFAFELNNFDGLSNHALRVIRYAGNNKMSAIVDQIAGKGVAVGFEGLLSFIKSYIPRNPETLQRDGRMEQSTDYPNLAIREIIANQLVHQDFAVKGSAPTIEIFDNRIVFTNPGAPINKPDRLLDMPPISRNEALADLFKKMHLVESRGSGIDKVIITLEQNLLPAPDISVKENFTVVTLFQRRAVQDMNNREKVNAIFYHSAILYLEDRYMTNKTVRERFGLTPKESAAASKLITLALKNGKIKAYDENAGRKNMQYIPYWGIGYDE